MVASRYILFFLIFVGLSSCGIFNKSDAVLAGTCSSAGSAPSGPSGTPLEYYTSTVYPQLMKCGSCHNVQSPTFFNQDASASFAAVQDYIDRLTIKEADGHCGPACSGRGPVSAAVDVFRNALCVTEFNPVELEPDRFFTVAVDTSTLDESFDDFIVAMDPARTDEKYQAIEFSVSLREIPATETQPAFLIVRDLKVRSPDTDFRALGTRLQKSGVDIVDASWELIDQNFAQNGTNNVPQNAFQDFIISSTTIPFQKEVDQLTFSVRLRDRNGPPGSSGGGNGNPEASAYYAANVYPIIIDRCIACHGFYNVPADLQENEAKDRVVAGEPLNSLFLRKPTLDLINANPNITHGGGLRIDPAVDTAEVNAISTWINMLAE